SSIQNKDKFCGPKYSFEVTCPPQSCPTDNNFEYVQGSAIPCFCASPFRIGYRLKSPSFSYNQPYHDEFEEYVTSSLNLEFYQLSMDSIMWEKGPRLRMHLKLFPKAGTEHSNTFSRNEVLRIRGIYTTWVFRGSDLFGPYELLNFTLVRPYANMIIDTPRKGISKAVLVTVVAVAVACALLISSVLTVVIKKRHEKYKETSSRKSSSNFQEMALATQNFSSSSVVGRGGYGKVYKGILWDGTVVAIKHAEEGSLQGEKEFLAEIELLSRLHHRNLVSLVGYCGEEQEKMLVYEFISRGTLRDRLNGMKLLRLEILHFAALWCCNDKPEKRPSMLDVVRELEHILEKMPETGPEFSKPESRLFVESSSTSLFYSSSNVQGSDLSSGGNPIVYPR
ncbi:probable LRR receptor-like serine/threonine-protein kinase isoform X1, partial [Tanacetum coccineum]